MATSVHVLILLMGFGGCYCTVVTDLGYQGLTEIPQPDNIPSNTSELNLRDNQLQFIPEGTLCHITELKVLKLMNNQLSSLGNLSCVGHSLTYINLINNPLKELPTSAFLGLEVLSSLYLARTQLAAFPDLWDVADTLQTLAVDSNKDIGGLPPTETFAQLTSLTRLNIIAIGLTSFPDLSLFYDRLIQLQLGWEDWTISVDINEVNKFTKLTHLTLANAAFTALPVFNLPQLLFLNIAKNDMSSVPSENYVGYPKLQTFYMSECSLTDMPDLSGFAETLLDISLNHNQLQEVNRELLCELPNIKILRFYDTNLNPIPCPCSLLDTAVIGHNGFTDLPRIASCAKDVHFQHNAVPRISGASAATLRNLNYIILSGNPLEKLEDILDLELNPSATIDVRSTDALGLCKCEHVWLKIAQELGATVRVTDVQCGESLWSALSSAQLMERCDQSSLTEVNTSPSTGWSIMRPKAASCELPVHAYYSSVLQVHCARHCFSRQGRCVAYKFRLTGGRYGSCQLLVPSVPADDVISVPDGGEAGWKCFTASPDML